MKVNKTTLEEDINAAGLKQKVKKPYQKEPLNLPGVNEPEAAVYATTKHTTLHAVPGKFSKKGNPEKGISSPYLVYVSKAGKNTIQFSDEGIPVHKISFDEKLDVIANGFTKKRLLELKDRYGITAEALAKILNITNRTIQTKAMTFKFTGNVAEKILGLSEVYSYGIEVFEKPDKFKRWLQVPSSILGGKRPVDLLLTQLGMQQVHHELARIDYGIY